MSFEEAATIPAAFCTSMYALNYLVKLEKDETVLIHAAAGGVGMISPNCATNLFKFINISARPSCHSTMPAC
jgi:NADPH:quinone reductase-like Zn-dependent oxidoreductase